MTFVAKEEVKFVTFLITVANENVTLAGALAGCGHYSVFHAKS
jgi:hypothetical protein